MRSIQSYGASGDQERALAAGQKADLVFLAVGSDMGALVDAGVVEENWDEQSYHGIVADSVVAFVFRNSNPKQGSDLPAARRSPRSRS